MEWWLLAIGFSLMIFCYDEARKFVIRKCPGGKHAHTHALHTHAHCIITHHHHSYRLGGERDLLLIPPLNILSVDIIYPIAYMI